LLHRIFFEQSPDILLVAAAGGRIVQANSKAVGAYGYSREELLSLRLDDLGPVGQIAARLAV
jgi:PAS domain S-box-containing protein